MKTMLKQPKSTRSRLASGLAMVVLGSISIAAINARAGDCVPPPSSIDGVDLLTTYNLAPNASALQDNPTQFGDAALPQQDPSQGNEIDQLYIRNTDTTLYFGVAGNTNRNDAGQNTILIFIDTGSNGGTAILNTAGITGSNALKNMDIDSMVSTDGAALDFAPEYCLAVYNETIAQVVTQRAFLHNLTVANDVGIALTENTHFSVDNSNLAGVSAEPAHDPTLQEVNAVSANTGVEFAIPLSMLTPLTSTSSIDVQALIVSGTGFISNQSLPPLKSTVGSTGGGVGNVGNQNPTQIPTNIVDFADDNRFPGLQHLTYQLTSPGSAPGGSLDGAGITDANYGAPNSIQNNYTGFGDAAPFSSQPSPGSELDQIWVTNDFSKIYIAVTGNVPVFDGNNNSILIFVDNGNGLGTNSLLTASLSGGSGALQNLEGLTFDPAFAPYFVIQYWRGDGSHHAIYQDLEFGVAHPMEFSNDNARHIAPAVQAFSADLSNILGINSIRGDDPIRQAARHGAPATRALSGVQFSIKLDELGIDPQTLPFNIKLFAMIVSSSGFMSNQALPPLNPTDPVPETANVSFSNAPLPANIPDNPNPALTDLRAVSAPNITRITDVNVSVNITHPDVSQLAISLQAEDRIVLLKAAGGASSANLAAIYDSEGGGGTVLPAESLLTFNDLNPNTNWTIIVTDTLTGQTGSLDSWGLDLTMHKGGAVNCLEFYDAVDNPVDFGTPAFPGDQFIDLTVDASVNQPSSFSGQNIPTAFLPNNPRASQNNYTCFGDAATSPPTNLPGSEMDQMYIKNSNDRLRLAITGNLENNGNAYVLFLDTVAGGQATITGQTSPPGSLAGLNNLSFDSGFEPDYAVVVQRDSTAGVPVNDYNVFLKTLTTNNTRSLGRLSRGSGTGILGEAIPNQNGSELDQLFIQNDMFNLYLGLTGNLEANGNTIVVFLETGAGGPSNALNTDWNGFPGPLRALSGDVLDTGIKPNYAIVVQRNGGNFSAQLVDLLDIPPGVTVTNLTFTTTIGGNTYVGDNTNASGVNDVSADDPAQQIINAATAARGVQFALSRASIGSPADNSTIRVCAAVTSSGGFWSNQVLPGVGGAQDNLGASMPAGVDLGNATFAPGDQFHDYVMADDVGTPYSQPSSFTGSTVSTSMGAALATQNNYTGFGNAVLVNPGNANCTQVALDDSNTLGVTSSSAAGAATATNGMEYDIHFSDIGLTPLNLGGQLVTVKAFAVLTGPSGYLSNQLLPGAGRQILDGQGNPTNLGFIPPPAPPPGGLNLGDPSPTTGFPGNQFLPYTLVVPCSDHDADINNDDVLTGADATAFVNVLLGNNIEPCAVEKADFLDDNILNGKDIPGFVDAFMTP
jgi:subtilisin-like proprotein convertase family protein